MIKCFRNISLISVICLFIACEAAKTEEQTELLYELTRYDKENCDGDKCAKVSFLYPYFDESHPLSRNLNAHIEEQLKMYLQFGVFDDYATLDEAVEHYFSLFEQSGDTTLWSVDVEGQVSFQNDRLLSMEFVNTSLIGHDQPSNHLMFLNFDLEDGTLLLRDEIVLDEAVLLEKAERKFRRHHAVAEEVSLAEDGRFFLEGTRFFLPFSMGYRGADFVLFYNYYEICPIEMGATEITFPLEDLDGIILTQN
ncbi:hypothetical protein KI659_13025 [Litoribacter alkaliphilus]|uniref:DUF3298 domain-containing protein n=1 Tax=Litoribacter ruber TaxID=702568 RepID=A0AAP2CJ96_9BACT|nr:hypothetical protein [Litoribacter alkaliphilus]MBS9524935.1 hypothetical protein [Litoribacter alkaliphilus]